MASKSCEKASPTSSSSADDIKRANKPDIVVSSAAISNSTDDHDDDGDHLLYPSLAALSIQPILSSFTTPSSSPTSSWHLWRYNCRDFSVHGCKYPPNCGFCTEINKLRESSANPKDATKEQWANYLERGHAFNDLQSVLEYLDLDTDNVLPSKLARQVFFDHKLGTGFFRTGIEPIAESPENLNGGAFQLLMLATKGAAHRQLVKSFDTIFAYTIKLIAELPESIMKCVNGVFYRCTINPGKRLPRNSRYTYLDHENLPIMCKLEVWIGEAEQQHLVYRELITKIKEHIENLSIPPKAYRNFFFINRPKFWEEQKLKEQMKNEYMVNIALANDKN